MRGAINAGAKPLLDGRNFAPPDEYKGGFYLGPTILDEVTPGMEVEQEEIFGPVIPIVRARSFDEALEITNNRKYGNTATIFTSSGRYFREFAKKAKVGNVAANMSVAQPHQFFPFPGRKRSHYGALTGQAQVIDFFTDMKVIMWRWW